MKNILRIDASARYADSYSRQLGDRLIDLVCRARLTFRYGENGPVGLLSDRQTYLLITSGGTPIDSEIDLATGDLKQVLGFIGIHDVEVIAGDRLMSGANAKLAQAQQQIDQIVAALV